MRLTKYAGWKKLYEIKCLLHIPWWAQVFYSSYIALCMVTDKNAYRCIIEVIRTYHTYVDASSSHTHTRSTRRGCDNLLFVFFFFFFSKSFLYHMYFSDSSSSFSDHITYSTIHPPHPPPHTHTLYWSNTQQLTNFFFFTSNAYISIARKSSLLFFFSNVFLAALLLPRSPRKQPTCRLSFSKNMVNNDPYYSYFDSYDNMILVWLQVLFLS